MREVFSRPAIINEARDTSKGRNPLLEILLFIIVLVICSIPQGIIVGVTQVVSMLSNPDIFKDLYVYIDTGRYEEYLNAYMNSMPEWIMIVTLASEIVIIVLILLYCRYIEGRKIRTLGFCKTNAKKYYVAGLIIGAAMLTGAASICIMTQTANFTGISTNFAPVVVIIYLIGYMVQGMAEEVMCRGFLMVSISRKSSLTLGIILNSLVFAVLHLANSGITLLAFINLLLFGIFMSLVFIKTESIFMVSAIHSAWNFAQGNLLGIQVSGMKLQTSVFSVKLLDNYDTINGGSFGLEGGLAVTVILVVAIAIVDVFLVKKNKNIAQ